MADQEPSDIRTVVLARVEQRITTFLEDQHARWASIDPRGAIPVEVITDLMASGGRRLRAQCCVTGFLAAGGNPISPTVVDAAAALEMLHTCAIIHDDIIGTSPLFQRVPSTHRRYAEHHRDAGWHGDATRYGESVALLAGDLALLYSDQFIGGLPRELRPIWDSCRIEMVIGQFLDAQVAAQVEADPVLTRWIGVCKSGRYTIEMPLVIGVILADPGTGLTANDTSATQVESNPDGPNPDEICPDKHGSDASGHDRNRREGHKESLTILKGLTAYGRALGEALQLREDLIDLVGDADGTGQTIGRLDPANQRMTPVVAMAIRSDERLAAAVLAGRADRDAVLETLRTTHVIDDVERRIARLVRQANRVISRTPVSEWWRNDFAALAKQVAYRHS